VRYLSNLAPSLPIQTRLEADLHERIKDWLAHSAPSVTVD
jgi:hypothetical protein